VVGLYNTFEAAIAQKVRRLVFSSSCQAVCGYPLETTITGQMMPAPVSLYGATKALGEVMGRWYHDKHQLEFVALRIGWFQSYEEAEKNFRNKPSPHGRALWLSPKDAVQLLCCSAEAPSVGYCIAGGTSKTKPEWLSLQQSRDVLGYFPEDDADQLFGPPPPASASA
ncbi:MAG TPA: NAD(P)-dependent oxidoreductase, partial [Planctomycetota bacterium]|nr:NAD(P)-dependent oxidoreductase [Planctomycetota bacterium]